MSYVKLQRGEIWTVSQEVGGGKLAIYSPLCRGDFKYADAAIYSLAMPI